MILAWWVLAAVSMLIARHFKPFWSHTKPGGLAIWFQVVNAS
jgi:hypothetical protein